MFFVIWFLILKSVVGIPTGPRGVTEAGSRLAVRDTQPNPRYWVKNNDAIPMIASLRPIFYSTLLKLQINYIIYRAFETCLFFINNCFSKNKFTSISLFPKKLENNQQKWEDKIYDITHYAILDDYGTRFFGKNKNSIILFENTILYGP